RPCPLDARLEPARPSGGDAGRGRDPQRRRRPGTLPAGPPEPLLRREPAGDLGALGRGLVRALAPARRTRPPGDWTPQRRLLLRRPEPAPPPATRSELRPGADRGQH